MSESVRQASPPEPPRAIEPAFAPLALWTAGSFALLLLSADGPKLWATQGVENAAVAVGIVAAGQALLAAIAWPIWTRSPAATIGIIVSAPAWLLLAGRLAEAPLPALATMAWKLIALLLALAIIRLATPRAATGLVWSLVVGASLGGPALWLLSHGG